MKRILLALLLLSPAANALGISANLPKQFGFPPVSSVQFKVNGVLQTPTNYVNFSTGLSGSLSAGTLTITTTGGAPVPQTRLINTTSPLGGGGALSGDLTLTCTTCAVTTGYTMTGDITLANSTTALTSGAYALNIKAGSAAGGIVLTPMMADSANQVGVSILNTNGIDTGFSLLRVRTGYAGGGVDFGIGTGTAGITCREGQFFIVDTGGSTVKKVQCLSGADKVKDCALTVNLTSIAGVAMSTVSAGGQLLVCTQGFVNALSTDANCTAGAPAGTDGTGTAGHVQCTTAPPINALVGRVSTAQSGTAVRLQIGY